MVSLVLLVAVLGFAMIRPRDLPEALVAVHMLGACLLVIALTFGVLSLSRR